MNAVITSVISSAAVKTMIFMAFIGFAALLIGIRRLLDDLRDMPRNEPNVGDE